MVNGSKVTCEKLVLGANSEIRGRNGLISSQFEFTGTGTGVIPVLLLDTSTLPDFNDVTFNPTLLTTDVQIPAGFSAKTLSIKQGIVNFEGNLSTVFTAATSLTMLGDTYLKFGGTSQLPYNAYTLAPTSTIDYTGAIQTIRALPAPDAYTNVTLSGAGVKTLGGEVNIGLTLTVADGVTLKIGDGNTLALNGTYLNTGTGSIRGSKTSNLWYKGYADSTFNFDQVTPDGNALNNVTVGLSNAEGGLLPSIGNNLNLIVGDKLDIYGVVTLTSGHLETNGNVTLKSDASTTAFVAPIIDGTPDASDTLLQNNGITGNVTVERYIPAGSNVDGTNVGRAYRALSSSVTGGTIFSNWQESGSTAAAFGTHITGKKGTVGQFDDVTGLDYTASGNSSMYTYINGWYAVTNTKNENLIAGKPYLITIRGDRTINLASNASAPTNTTLRSTGEIIAGPLEVLALNPSLGGFSFVGNPYQAPVDLSLIYEGGVGARWVDLGTSYTVFDTKIGTRGAYVTYDFDSGSTNVDSSMNNTLEPNQAFFVQTAGATPTLVFNETDKDVASNGNAYVPMYRKAKTTNSLIKGSVINAGTNKALDGFILAFSDSYNNAIVAEDSQKISNADENFSIKNGTSNLVIDKRSFPAENDVITLNLTEERLSDYVLKFDVSNFDAKDAYLVDAYTKKETALKNNQINSYAFSVDATPASAAADRFSIVFKTATSLSINSNSIKELAVYPNPVVDNKFTIRANQDFGGKKATLSIVNTLGQKVYCTNGTFSTDGSIAVKPTNALNKGIYFLKVAVDGKEETKKLIIK
jgi:predicted 3-demethylubiquinone-9 3-methyltransferase (glyoxalase superfamily)